MNPLHCIHYITFIRLHKLYCMYYIVFITFLNLTFFGSRIFETNNFLDLKISSDLNFCWTHKSWTFLFTQKECWSKILLCPTQNLWPNSFNWLTFSGKLWGKLECGSTQLNLLMWFISDSVALKQEPRNLLREMRCV